MSEPEPEPERSFPELFGELARELATLVRQELALAADEMTQKARDAARDAKLLGIGALLGAVSLMLFASALVFALSSVLPMWASALVIAALVGAIGFAVYRRASSRLRSMELLPTETFASLKQDGTWAKQQIEETRDQVATAIGEVRHQVVETIGEVRRRLEPPPAKKKATRRPAKRKPPA